MKITTQAGRATKPAELYAGNNRRLSMEEKKDIAIKTLSEMIIDDDDVALVVVASQYRRLQSIAMIIGEWLPAYPSDVFSLLKSQIEGTEVEEFINDQFVKPAIERVITRANMIEGENLIKARRGAYQRGKNEVIQRIVDLLKGGEG